MLESDICFKEKMSFTLEEFMLWREVANRKEYLALPAESWLTYYNISSSQYEKYKDSPPIGSKVITLVNGHGSGPGAIRTLALQDNVSFYKDYYLLVRDDGISLVNKKYWYRHFAVLSEDKEEIKFISKQVDSIWRW